MLDITTISVFIVALGLLMAAMLWLAGRQAHGMDGVNLWAGGQLAISAGVAAQMAPAAAPAWIPDVLGNSLIFCGSALLYCGIKLYKEDKPPVALLGAGLAATLAVSLGLTFFLPNASLRVALLSALLFLPVACSARELLVRVEQPLRTAYWLTGGVYALFASVLLLRAVIMGLLEHDAELAAFLTTVAAAIGTVVTVCSSFGYVLMINYRMAVELERLASLDALTGALNRRSLNARIHELQLGAPEGRIAVAMLDLDHFKAINDSYGHPVGDQVLEHFAQVAREALRGGDLFARMGGEEFCVVMAGANEDDAAQAAERIRQATQTRVPRIEGVPIHYTVSAGVASGLAQAGGFEQIARLADSALYHAKQEGRDRVERASTLERSVRAQPHSADFEAWLAEPLEKSL